MMSQKSAEINSNANPPVAAIDVHIDKEHFTPRAKKLLNGWGDWSLEDIVRIISSTKWQSYLSEAGYIGKIIFLKLLEVENNPNIPFEQIEAVVHTALYTNVGFFDNHIFHVTGSTQGLEVICNFFKEFVKNGEKDARYYKLIDEMLTYQTVRNESWRRNSTAKIFTQMEVTGSTYWCSMPLLACSSF